MKENIDLTQGKIFNKLVALSLPIMATSFILMSYNLMDLFWLGKLDTESVAAAGTVGFFIWLANSIVFIPKIGAEVGVAESLGGKNIDRVQGFIGNALKLDLIIAILYSFILFIFRFELIGFFKLNDVVSKLSIEYLEIVAMGMIFVFLNPVMSGIFNASGDSKTPFKINSCGLVINIILDPILIFGYFGFPVMGIKGAAVATVIAQFIVSIIFIVAAYKKMECFRNIKFLSNFQWEFAKKILSLGVPAAFQAGLFAIISMFMARIIANWGQEAIAAQKIGNQIESITWMTTGGFSVAISAFVAQNRGAGKADRIVKGVKTGLKIVGAIGLIATFALFLGAEPLFKLFIPNDPKTLAVGIKYIRILAISEILLSTEIGLTGAFNGLGLTQIPAYTSVALNLLRIPFAFVIMTYNMDLSLIWWVISISAMLKGLVLIPVFIMSFNKRKHLFTKEHIVL